MKYIILSVLMIVSTLANAAVEKVKVHGSIKGLGNEEVVLLNSDYTEITKTKGVNDQFEIITNVETGDGRYYNLYIPSIAPLGPSMSIPTMFFFIDSSDIEITANITEEIIHGEKSKKINREKIKGSEAIKEYEEIFDHLPVKKMQDEISPLYNKAFDDYNYVAQTDENRKALSKYGHLIDSLQKVEAQQILDLIPTKPKSKMLALIVYNYYNDKPANELSAIINQFDLSIRDCYGLKKMQDKFDLINGCEIGQAAPDFELKNSEGKEVKLSSLRGKYTLIDFWASWCGPCRKEIPNLKKVYADYKDKGLQLVGVSLDETTEKWYKAIEEEELNYLQLNDPKNITGKLYNFNGIPFIILISPEGIILEKGLRGTEVREMVAKYLKK
ncbi:MAG: TlpA disulfide reductase family protein [Odoribacter sp.]